MYSYGYASSANSTPDPFNPFFAFLIIAIAIIVFIAWLVATNKLVKLAMEKDPTRDTTGVLWFIGICASPIVLGLYVCALPDKRTVKQASSENDQPSDLPTI